MGGDPRPSSAPGAGESVAVVTGDEAAAAAASKVASAAKVLACMPFVAEEEVEAEAAADTPVHILASRVIRPAAHTARSGLALRLGGLAFRVGDGASEAASLSVSEPGTPEDGGPGGFDGGGEDAGGRP